jgi:hypothetical protein
MAGIRSDADPIDRRTHSFATPRSRYDRAKKRKKAHAVTGSNSANRYLSIGGDTIVQ